MNTCQYQHINNSRHHKKGEICNKYIRTPSSNFCWAHRDSKQVKPIKEEPHVQLVEEPKESQFIQLTNS